MKRVVTTLACLMMVLSSLLAASLSECATTECVKTFVVTGKGGTKEVQLRKFFVDISPATKQQSRDIEFDIYDVKNPNHNYTRIGNPTRYQNCAGHVMEWVLNTGQHAYNVDAFKKEVLEPYSSRHFTISKTLTELDDIEQGDVLYYGGGLHVAYVKKVEARPGLKGKAITIESKADQESIWEATLEPTEYDWHKDRDPLVRLYGLPEVYRIDKSTSARPKYQGDCDLEDLTIEVKEGDNYIVGATVETMVGGQVSKGVTAGPKGSATIKRAKGKEATVTVSMNDYYSKTEPVPESSTLWTVFLYKKPKVDGIKNMLEGKIQRVIQLRDAARAAQEKAKASIGGSRAQAVQDAAELVRALETQKKIVEQANTDCLQIPTLMAQIAADVAKAQTARNAVQAEMQTIGSRVATCTTKADVDFLDQAWDRASQNAGTALAYGARAEGTVQKALTIIAKANAARSSLTVSKAPPDPSIKYLIERLDLMSLPDQNYYRTLDSLISDADAKAKAFRTAKDDLIWEIEGYRGKMGKENEALFDALSARVRAITLTEENLKGLKDNLLKELRDIYDAKKNGKDLYSQLLTLPLCAGANTGTLTNYLNEAKKAQSDVVQSMGGDLLGRINACRARLNLPLPPGTPQLSGTGLGKPWRAFGIYPRTAYLTPGQRQEFEALIVYVDGSREDISTRNNVTWEPSRVFSSMKEGTYYVKVTVRLDEARTDTATVHVMIPKENVLLVGPDRGKKGTQATLEVTGLGNAPGSTPQGYQFQWLGDGKALGSKTTRQVVKLNTPGSHTVAVKIWRWTENRWQFFVERSKKLVIGNEGDGDGYSGPTRELSYDAVAGKNPLSGTNPIRGFGDSTTVDVWVPFAFQFGPLSRAVAAKIVMVVKPIDQLIGTDQLVLKGKGKDQVVYSGFSSLKAKAWNTVEVSISNNAELMDAIRTTGRIEGVIQDDTAVQSVKLIIKVPQ